MAPTGPRLLVRPASNARQCPLCHGPLLDAPSSTCPACWTRQHVTCATELGVTCATLGCAGASVDVAIVAPVAPTLARARSREPGLLIPLACAWVGFVLNPALAIIPTVMAVRRAAPRGRRALLASIALGPLVAVVLLSAAWGALGFVTGTAKLRGVGRPAAGYWNPDPEVRCGSTPAGCTPSGHDAFLCLPNNLVLRALGLLFGPMRGAYAGPYPAEDEARALVDAAAPDVARPVRLGLENLFIRERGHSPAHVDDLRVVDLRRGGRLVAVDGEIWLVDAGAGRVFARYDRR